MTESLLRQRGMSLDDVEIFRPIADQEIVYVE